MIAKRVLLTAAGVALIGAAGIAAAFSWTERELGPIPLEPTRDLSVTVLDRKARLLRAYTTDDGRWRLPIETEDVDKRYIRMLMTYEDRRFHDHGGVDYIAIARAAWQAARYQKIVSGASTLSMQVARLVTRKHEKTAAGKWRQIVRAHQLERQFNKDEILRIYFLLAPFGGNLEGVRAASLSYFGREPRRLSIAEAALLVALPQSPEARRPDRHPQRAKRARFRVLQRMVRYRVITPAERDEAHRAPIPTKRLTFPMTAPHLSDRITGENGPRIIHRTTLDRDHQIALESRVAEHAAKLGDRVSAALIAVDNRTGHTIARVASAGYLDHRRFGAIDMTSAIRSPGSTLKPFIYGLAFERGFAHPETLIEDRPVRFGTYAPKNFDERYRGTVSIREALQLSLNIPAVKVLSAVSPQRLVQRFRTLDSGLNIPESERPSLAIALGGLGMTLENLVMLYAAIAENGVAKPLITTPDLTPSTPKAPLNQRVLSPIANWYVQSILAGTPPPQNAPRGRVAYKTGTSYGFRDAWAIGFDGRHTIGVWIGRPDGASTPGLTGLTAAGPLLFDAFRQLSKRPHPLPSPPRGVLRRTAHNLPLPLRHFRPVGTRSGRGNPQSMQIIFPPNNAEFALDDFADPAAGQAMLLRVDGGKGPFSWFVDGNPISASPHRTETFWQPNGRGFVTLSVMDATGASDRVRFRLR